MGAHMPEWLQSAATILIPLAGMMWAMHTAAKRDRERLSARLEHIHDCVEKRASEQMHAVHRLDIRLAVIESRGHQVRRNDHSENRATEQEAP